MLLLMIGGPPSSSLFPYAPLFRSDIDPAARVPRTVPAEAPVVLAVDRLTRRPWFEDVTLAVRAGEIVGLVGLVGSGRTGRSEEHTAELQSRLHLVCRLPLDKKKVV